MSSNLTVSTKLLRLEAERLQAALGKLQRERVPLTAEGEFYVNKPLPPKIRSALDAVDTRIDAQRRLLQSNKQHAFDVNARCNAERDWMRVLWSRPIEAGAQGVYVGEPCAPLKKVAANALAR